MTTTPSPMDYPPQRGIPWKCIAKMVRFKNSCPGCHFNDTDVSPRLNFHQEVGCQALAKHYYICRKDIPALATIVDKLGKKFPRTLDQPRPTIPGDRRASDETVSETDSARRVRVHPPSIPTIDSPPPPPSWIHFSTISSRNKPPPSSESSSASAPIEQVCRPLLVRFGQRSVWGNGY